MEPSDCQGSLLETGLEQGGKQRRGPRAAPGGPGQHKGMLAHGLEYAVLRFPCRGHGSWQVTQYSLGEPAGTPQGRVRRVGVPAPRRAPALRIPLSSSKSVFPPPALQRWDSGPPGGRSQENFGGGGVGCRRRKREGHQLRVLKGTAAGPAVPGSPLLLVRTGWLLRGVRRQPHAAPVQAKLQDSGTSRWKGGQVSCAGARRSPPRRTGRSWQSCWPSQEPGITLLAVLLPELFVQVDVLRGQGTVGQLSPLLQDVVFVI